MSVDMMFMMLPASRPPVRPSVRYGFLSLSLFSEHLQFTESACDSMNSAVSVVRVSLSLSEHLQ